MPKGFVVCYNYIKFCLNVNEPGEVFPVKEKKGVLLAYGVLLICMFFTLGYLLGHGNGETRIQVVSAPSSVTERAGEESEDLTVTEAGDILSVNINTADSTELEQLPGIGPELAGRIIAYRSEHGDFVSKEQIMDVKGIGEKRYADLEEIITVGGDQ